jgi:hypothetical protein
MKQRTGSIPHLHANCNGRSVTERERCALSGEFLDPAPPLHRRPATATLLPEPSQSAWPPGRRHSTAFQLAHAR